MAATSVHAASPWLAEDQQQDPHQLEWSDELLDQLACSLGGKRADSGPGVSAGAAQQLHRQYSVPVGQAGCGVVGQSGFPPGALHQNSLPVLPSGLSLGLQQLQGFGSAPDQAALPNSLSSDNNMLHPAVQPLLMFRPAFGAAHAGMMAGVAFEARPAGSHKSHSPASSGGQGAEEGVELCDAQRRGGSAKGAINKGALAQKRFRERQKEKMRASEQQVVDLTRKLGQLEMEKSRLASRARLLEQVVSLNMLHEAKLHTNREIMVREQEMLLEDLAAFMLATSAAAGQAAAAASASSSPDSPEWLQGTASLPAWQQQVQQQQAVAGLVGMQQQPAEQQQLLQQQEVTQLLQQQQGGTAGVVGSSGGGGSSNASSGQVLGLVQVIRGWTVQTMMDQGFPQYISCLQQLLPHVMSSSPVISSSGSNAAAASCRQAVESLVLQRREMTDRHALFSHYYWAVWCFNRGELAAQGLAPPTQQQWEQVMHSLNLSKEQLEAIAAARSGLLSELHRVAAEWAGVLPTLALQLLQVPRAQWHTVAAVQAMVMNLAAEREAVVGFLHTVIDEVLTPVQEGQLEAGSYPWCPDVWAIAGAAAQLAASSSAAAAAGGRGRAGRKSSQAAAAAAAQAEQQQQLAGGLDDDPMAALSMGTDVLQPLMPFMTAFQLLRAPVTAKGAGLRLKRALLLDPFRTVVPAAAYSQPTAAEVSGMSLLDAHCGTFQQVMLYTWLKANLPSYVTLLGMQSSSGASAAAATTTSLQMPGAGMALHFAGSMGHLAHSLSAGNLAGQGGATFF